MMFNIKELEALTEALSLLRMNYILISTKDNLYVDKKELLEKLYSKLIQLLNEQKEGK